LKEKVHNSKKSAIYDDFNKRRKKLKQGEKDFFKYRTLGTHEKSEVLSPQNVHCVTRNSCEKKMNNGKSLVSTFSGLLTRRINLT